MARSFTAAGMKVVIADIEDKALEAARIEFQDSNADVLMLNVDVTDRAAMQQAADRSLWQGARALQQCWCRSQR
jgi:NADP-dependent 3-hydroxy acid dehydrogenase YdfG